MSTPANLDEIKRRAAMARDAIKAAFGTEADKLGATLFVSHHLKEVDSSYWKRHLATESPDPSMVLGLLKLQSHPDSEVEVGGFWDGEDETDILDFTLPEQITNYVICVRFDKAGDVSMIAMES